MLWEILSPSPELRDHIDTFKQLARLYAAVRNAYTVQTGFGADLARKTSRLVQESVSQEGLGLVDEERYLRSQDPEDACRRAGARRG